MPSKRFFALLKPLILAAVFFALLPESSLHAAKKLVILVEPFQNTGQKKFDWVAAGLTDTLIGDLRRIGKAEVLREEDRRKALKEIAFQKSGLSNEESSVQTGKMLGASVIFRGSYVVFQNRIRIVSRLIKVEDARILKSSRITGNFKSLFEIQDRLAVALLRDAGSISLKNTLPIRITKSDIKKVERKWKPDIKAYRLYARAMSLHVRNPEKSLKFLGRAISISPLYAEALSLSGLIYSTKISQYKRGAGFLIRAGEAYKKRGDKNSIQYVSLLNHIGQLYQSLGKIGKSLYFFNLSRRLYKQIDVPDTILYATILNNTALTFRYQGKLKLALRYFNQCIRLYQKKGLQDSFQYAIVLNNIGLLYQDSRRYSSALKYFTRASKIFRKHKLNRSLTFAIILNNLGLSNRNLGNFTEAARRYLEAEKIYRKTGMLNIKMRALLLHNIAHLYAGKKRYGTALKFYRLAEEIYKKLRLTEIYEYGVLLQNIGGILILQKKYDRSLVYLLKAGKVYRIQKMTAREDYAVLLGQVATVHAAQGKKSSAAKLFDASARIYQKLGRKKKANRARNRSRLLKEGSDDWKTLRMSQENLSRFYCKTKFKSILNG